MNRTGSLLSRSLLGALLLLAGCRSDFTGVGDLTLVLEGASGDSMWVGLPGADTVVRVRLYDLEGNPVAGAEVSWTPSGTGSNVSTQIVRSDRQGYAVARWRIGTDARDQQTLRFTARRAGVLRELVIRGRVVPSVVAALRLEQDGPLVARLGDTLELAVQAIDPFGNAFAAPDPEFALSDSGLGAIVDGRLVAGPRRGRTVLRIASGGTAMHVSLDVVQRIAAIEVSSDSLRFTSLRAEWPVSFVLRDDRGLLVQDTTPDIAIMDTSVARWLDGRVRAAAPGATVLRAALGPAAVLVPVRVTQRIHSLRLVRDTVHFDALSDTTTLRPVAHDSLGSPISEPRLEFRVSGDSIARIGSGPLLESLRPGTTVVTVTDPETGIATSVEVVVRQRVVAIDMPGSPLEFDAIGDSAIVIATARDRLGATVSGAAFEYSVADSGVAVIDSGTNRVRAVAPGTTTVTVRDPESGLEATRPIQVEQVATQLNVAVLFDGEVIALPEGAPLSLACEAKDRNGHAIAGEIRLVRAVRGTVSGSDCSDAVIQRSGYDTLVFAFGVMENAVPVIVATRPDSVGVVVAAQPQPTDPRQQFVGEDLAHPLILALRPLVADILADYGNPTSSLDRARAIRDWVARTAIYPDSWVRPDTTTSNLSVLPPGKTWFDVNRLLTPDRWNADVAYWKQCYADGYCILDRLLGTLDQATGLRANDGLMEHVAGARYRIRDVESYHYVACSYQSAIASTLWAAAGLHGTVASILQHDASAVFIPELGRWVYQDPTYNEEYLLDGIGEPLSPVEMLDISTRGQGGRLHPVKMGGPIFDPAPYPPVRAYTDPANHPEGMIIMGSVLYRRWVGNANFSMRFVQIDVPALRSAPAPWGDASLYLPVTPDVAFPTLAPVVLESRMEDSVAVVRMGSTYPNHDRFERRLPGGAWEPVSDEDVLPLGACKVEYRSLDAVGNASAVALLDVWVPRAESFVHSALPGSTRERAAYCVPPIQ